MEAGGWSRASRAGERDSHQLLLLPALTTALPIPDTAGFKGHFCPLVVRPGAPPNLTGTVLWTGEPWVRGSAARGPRHPGRGSAVCRAQGAIPSFLWDGQGW